MKICRQCNKEYEQQALFCTVCGTELEEKNETIQQIEQEISFCQNCGYRMEEKYTFCPQCGQNVSAESDNAMNKNSGKKSGKLKWLIAGIAGCLVIGAVFVGISKLIPTQKKEIAEEKERDVNELVYLKDDEYYIVNEEGKSVQLTSNYYGKVKEKSKEFYESGLWENDYNFDFDEVGYTKENLAWEEFWDMIRSYWRIGYVDIVAWDDKEMMIYSDEMDGEITLMYDEDVGEEYYIYNETGYNLYCRPMDNLEQSPILIDTEVKEYELIGDGYVSYVKNESEQEFMYSLSTMEQVSSAESADFKSHEENELYVKNGEDSSDESEGTSDQLYIHKAKGEKLLEESLRDFDDTAKEKGIYYYVNNSGEFYTYNVKDGKNLIAENVDWISDGFASGEIYYAVADEQKAKMGDYIKNDTANPDLWLFEEEYTYQIYHYFYYNGEESKELGMSRVAEAAWTRNNYELETDCMKKIEEASTADAYCVFKMIDPQEMPTVLQSELEEAAKENWDFEQKEEAEFADGFVSYEEWNGEVTKEVVQDILYNVVYNSQSTYALALQDADLVELEGEEINSIYFNEAGTHFLYLCDEGLMHGAIDGKKVNISCEMELFENTEIASCKQGYGFGMVEDNLWYRMSDSNDCSQIFYGNREKLDEAAEGYSIDTINKKEDAIYYLNTESGKYMAYQDGKLQTVVEGIDEWVRTEDNNIVYKKGNVTYYYDLINKKEIEIGEDICEYRLTNTGVCFYTKYNSEIENLYDLYLVVPDGENLLLEEQIVEFQ